MTTTYGLTLTYRNGQEVYVTRYGTYEVRRCLTRWAVYYAATGKCVGIYDEFWQAAECSVDEMESRFA